MIVAAVVGLLTVVGFILSIVNAGPSVNEETARVYARIESLQAVADDQQKRLRDNDLRVLNSTFRIQLANALSSMQEPLKVNGIAAADATKLYQPTEAVFKSDLTTQFDDAHLNVQLDEVYAREMNFQIENLQAMMQSTYRMTKSNSLREFLTTTYDELTSFSNQFDAFIVD